MKIQQQILFHKSLYFSGIIVMEVRFKQLDFNLLHKILIFVQKFSLLVKTISIVECLSDKL